MASPQCENGYTKIANELLEKLLLLRLPGNELRVCLAVIRLTYGYGKKSDAISYGQIAKAIGITRQRAIYYVQRLVSRMVLGSLKGGTRKPATIWFNKDYDQWVHSPNGGTSPKHETRGSPKGGYRDSPKGGTLQRKKEKEKKERESFSPNGEIAACPHQEIIDLYHEILPECSRVRKWTETRMKKLRARWREDTKYQNLEFWKSYFQNVRLCFWFTGDNDRNWYPDLEWLCEQRNFIRVWEKKYL